MSGAADLVGALDATANVNHYLSPQQVALFRGPLQHPNGYVGLFATLDVPPIKKLQHGGGSPGVISNSFFDFGDTEPLGRSTCCALLMNTDGIDGQIAVTNDDASSETTEAITAAYPATPCSSACSRRGTRGASRASRSLRTRREPGRRAARRGDPSRGSTSHAPPPA